jgi:copper chaperone
MTCSHCVSAVTKSVLAIDANARVEVDLGAHKVRVESGAAPEKIAAAISEAGYQVNA